VFDHVTIRVSDRIASERFYDTVLPTLGIERTSSEEAYPEWEDFSLGQADESFPPTRSLHIGFAARSRADVDEFWRAGTAAGYRDDGEPGLRPEYGPTYYGAFLLDPDGNSAEGVQHETTDPEGTLDHLWIRVRDVGAARRFYALVAPFVGFRLTHDSPERAQFANASTSFSVLAGTPTENLHMAFGTQDNAAVDAFHGALTEAGYRDNGPPGERPVYHPGYYGAYVLDPDGNNIELVNHNRG
jgi:catechol 2,3-dioxygenase-like lactoylglutathione lyase family enzyme